jgi:capsular exopolysaccharide synthesis family protein
LYLAPPYQDTDENTEDAKLPLAQYFWIVRRYRWRISGAVAVSVLATLVISARLTPIYESTATVDIDRQSPAGVVGEDATRSALNDSDQFMATQIKLVESDAVLRPVDERFQLRKQEGQSAALSARGDAAPVTLLQLKVARPPNTYLMQIGYRSADPQMAADAANAITQSYLEHSYEIRLRSSAGVASFMERQIEELKAKMERSSRALNEFERELNVINPEEKTNILSARLLQLNTEFTNAQSERLKREAEYQSVGGGSFEAALAAPEGEALRKLADHRNEAAELFAGVRSHYGTNHPEYRKAQAQVNQVDAAIEATRQQIVDRTAIGYREAQGHEVMVGNAVKVTKADFDRMNARSFEYQAVKREADADKNLYDELVRKIREAGINAGFQNGSIRIADAARPALKPVYPNHLLNVLLAFLLSTLLAVGAAVLSDLLDKTVRDPEQVARTLHAEVIGSLPLMKNKRTGSMAAGSLTALKNGDSGGGRGGMNEQRDLSGFGESVRALRNSILLGNFDRHYRSLLVTSAAPGDGKTTTAANLAAAHAEQGKRTLLIDGDLRRPSVHRNFNLPSVVGLSNALLGEIPWRAAIIQTEALPDLYILPAGPPSRRASDLVGRGLTELLEEASVEYDLVILDAPPLLGFAEPLQMATAVDGVIVVARAGRTSRRAVASVLATLNRLRAKVVGLVLNEVHKELSDSYYYGYVQAPAGRGPVAERYFHFDSWRVNASESLWVPAQIYVEEEASPDRFPGGATPHFKAQTRFWDYAATPSRKVDELTSILIESESALQDRDAPKDVSPLESKRAWELQSERNLLARLEKGGFLAPPGLVDEVLNTVVGNLIVSSKLGIEAHCRVLLTTPFETFAIGHTIVISRGLIDVLPDEASLALALASELAHIALGHPTQTQFAFNNQTMLSDLELLQSFRFQRPAEEMRVASEKAITMMRSSPYSSLANAGLFLKALAAHQVALPRLLQANLGDQVGDPAALARLASFAAEAPPLEEEKLEQIAALPLGSRVKVNPWTDQVSLVKTRPLALLSPREKMPFEVTPFVLYLTRSEDVSAKK